MKGSEIRKQLESLREYARDNNDQLYKDAVEALKFSDQELEVYMQEREKKNGR